jgi:hypothetical protein
MDKDEANTKSRIVTREQLKKLPPVEWLVEGIIPTSPAGAQGMFWGQPCALKSFLGVSLAGSIATGLPWMGREVKQGPAVYIAGEGTMDLDRRIRGWERAHQMEARQLYAVLEPVALDNEAEVERLIADLRTHLPACPALVIVDTLARCAGDTDENAARDVGRLIRHTDRLRQELGCVVLYLHHACKGNSEYRRSSALRAALDYEYCVERDGETKSINLICRKLKVAAPAPTITLAAREIDVSDQLNIFGPPENTLVIEPGETSAKANRQGGHLVREHREFTQFVNELERGCHKTLTAAYTAAGLSRDRWIHLRPRWLQRELLVDDASTPCGYRVTPTGWAFSNGEVDSAAAFAA